MNLLLAKKFREDYSDMNFTILELLLSLSGNPIKNGTLNPHSILFKRKKANPQKVVEQHFFKKMFYGKQPERDRRPNQQNRPHMTHTRDWLKQGTSQENEHRKARKHDEAEEAEVEMQIGGRRRFKPRQDFKRAYLSSALRNDPFLQMGGAQDQHFSFLSNGSNHHQTANFSSKYEKNGFNSRFEDLISASDSTDMARPPSWWRDPPHLSQTQLIFYCLECLTGRPNKVFILQTKNTEIHFFQIALHIRRAPNLALMVPRLNKILIMANTLIYLRYFLTDKLQELLKTKDQEIQAEPDQGLESEEMLGKVEKEKFGVLRLFLQMVKNELESFSKRCGVLRQKLLEQVAAAPKVDAPGLDIEGILWVLISTQI